MNSTTRREFIMLNAKMAGLVLGAMALGPGWMKPPLLNASEMAIPEPAFRDPNAGGMNVLVTYASRCGSTAGVAERIGQTLYTSGHSSQVLPVGDAKDLDSYDAVILGSAIRTGKWLPEAVDFVGTYRDSLSQKPVAYFNTCITACRPTEENLTKAGSFMDPLMERFPEVQPVSRGVFAGVLDYAKLSGPMRMVMKWKMNGQGIQEGDYRDWNAIETWGNLVSGMLTARLRGRQEEI
jgi:menaquinone-dependent protoporphyrinogen oxidase